MGAGRWSDSDYESYTTKSAGSRAAYTSRSVHQNFTSREVPAALDPRNITLRESCDSSDNPNSTPIIMGLDLSGSMGQYANLIATEALPKFMGDVLEERPVTDPHLMFMGVVDVHANRYHAPLQVSQFEADIRIIEQLNTMWIAGGGGGNRSESYELPWYFGAYKTKLDSYEKRGAKGFLFTMGDEEAPYELTTEAELEAVFGPGQYPSTMKPKDILAAAREKFHVFHIVIEEGSHFRGNPHEVRKSWTEMMGTSVLYLKDFRDLSEVVIATMKIVNGQDINDVIAASKKPSALKHAFQNALTAD